MAQIFAKLMAAISSLALVLCQGKFVKREAKRKQKERKRVGNDEVGHLQGDPSGLSQPPVDIKMIVAFQCMLLILKHNYCTYVTRRLMEADGSPCTVPVRCLLRAEI